MKLILDLKFFLKKIHNKREKILINELILYLLKYYDKQANLKLREQWKN